LIKPLPRLRLASDTRPHATDIEIIDAAKRSQAPSANAVSRALENLRAARAELEVAEHNKGGWRIRAIENANRAIAETERGMSFAR
jgi:hypothetical protein